jgi:hypothetical protein
MKNNYKKLFSSYKAPETPVGLTEKILSRIVQRERRILGTKIAISASIFMVSISAVILALKDLFAGLSQSGFFPLASLAFSDFSSISANFPDFAFSMIESFPIFTAAILLAGIMFAIWSMAAFIDETSLLKTTRFSFSK